MQPTSEPNVGVPTAMQPDWMGRSLWASGLLLMALGVFLFVDPFGNQGGSASAVTSATAVSAQSPATVSSTQPIETICVGQRVPGKNPTGDFDDSLGDVDPATWRHLKLRMTKSDGGRLELELLRPAWWVEAHDARIGGTIGLDLPEMGAQGVAEVLSIGDCPELSPGEGHVVTGTFAHSSTDVVDISVDGLSEPIGVTAHHPIWSVDREQFVEARKFHCGERMRSFSGDPVRVASLLPRPGAQLVYNLEVHGEHVYHVSSLGLLAHNTCAPKGTAFGGVVANTAEEASFLRNVRATFGEGSVFSSAVRHRGNIVIQRSDISLSIQNLRRMRSGNSPFVRNAAGEWEALNLHHVGRQDGKLIEIFSSHNTYNPVNGGPLHIPGPGGPLRQSRLSQTYWQQRLEDLINSGQISDDLLRQLGR